MGEEEQKKVEEVKTQTVEETSKDVSEEKSVIPVVSDHKDSDSKPPPADEKAIVPVVTPPPAPAPEKKPSGGSIDRDVVMAKVEEDKKLALVKAWEESEKSKAENKACKKLSDVEAWEKSKKATLEAELRHMEEKLEKKKAEYAEKMKNKVAEVHKLAEEKRAMIEAHKGEELLKAEECAAKFRVTGHVPKKFLGCF
ncbi:remorin-like [Chenopodium quinoa]|uniref:remorin-like n=1 Tax=Chenopodium quinoa TaxID=63459 RepID=UPI000B78DE53|nr:remorin-like [Chenopodium quinoa]